MAKTPIDPVSRVVSWIVFAFAVGCVGFGVCVWIATGGEDAGGMFAMAFVAGGVILAVPSLSFALTGEIRGLL